MSIMRAGSKAEALRFLASGNVSGDIAKKVGAAVRAVELDYETGWQDAVELGRLGEKRGIKVQYRGQESIAVRSREALLEGLATPKTTFRQRNLYCQFDLGTLADHELVELEAKATRLGDYILAGHLLRDVDDVW
ncbi:MULTISPECIES: PHA-granule associated protein 4 [Cupriavidus]|uniref:PHA-granule associated protein 4 n=1 Tax=Cupriavidus pauculus TaxID=82633 RepID=A0A5P2HBY8_9BURK|nr:PHA-granule associated protein 4 [Cupriavidus pauculus]QET05671.1 PHA-granule associated protein 4 [Cupriavidus pauculus]